ncbi:neutral zinc metallopeptidase, partial [Chromobacterium phragmitis]
RKIIMLCALGAALAGQTGAALAMPVNNSYIQSSANEIRGFLGSYARPTVYVDQRACGEPQSSAMACGPYTISVGTGFLQQQENSYGNYVAKFILAHEWGHSVQFANNIYKQAPMQELQADCVGGTFAKYAESNLRYPSFIENAVVSARNAADYAEHGTPSQRDYYSRYGYANGFSACMNRI